MSGTILWSEAAIDHESFTVSQNKGFTDEGSVSSVDISLRTLDSER